MTNVNEAIGIARAAAELDRGSPDELATELSAMQREFDLRVVGGCCGTDVEHVAAMSRALA